MFRKYCFFQSCTKLESEKDDLLVKIAEINQQVTVAKTKITAKDDEAKELQEKLDLKTSESNEMVLLQESLREKVKTVTDVRKLIYLHSNLEERDLLMF